MKNLKLNIKKFLALSGISLVLVSTAGCGKKADCDIKDYHAHKYVNNDGYCRYIDSEYLTYDGYERQDDYEYLNPIEKDYNKFLKSKRILRIEENIDAIQRAQEKNKDFLEYRYAYTYLMPVPIVHSTGKTSFITYMYVPTTHYRWTSDPNHSRLTGETRVCHYVYASYKIEKNEKGKFVLIQGPENQDIISTRKDYPFIQEKYYKIIDLANGLDASYEDMENDDVANIEEEQQENDKTEQGKTLRKEK